MIEITLDEPVLRAVLQHREILEERGWARSRARDYYDVWRVLKSYRDTLELSGFRSFLRRKCELRDVSFGARTTSSHLPS
ncbi:MAG: hypothetical protein V5A84_03315 [Planctomycetota bacterium]